MPDLKAHKKQAERNLAFYEAIPDDFPEWKSVALFYAALHVVDMVAAAQGVHPRNHDDREYNFLRPRYHKVWNQYRKLFAASRKARYLAGGQFDMNTGHVEHQLRGRAFKHIVLWAIEELGLDSLLGEKPVSSKEHLPARSKDAGSP